MACVLTHQSNDLLKANGALVSYTSFAGEVHGIYAILYALFDRNEQLDRAAMRRQVELCLAAGVHGIAALGLATEVAKLTEAERRTVMDWTAEINSGRVPMAFTIFGNSVAEQVAQVRHAETVGADWVILQPPVAGSFGATEYIRFFGRVAEATSLPVAIQNAPAFLGRGLTGDDLRTLNELYPNICLLKGEGSAVEIEQIIRQTGGRVPVLNGRAGVEMLDSLRAGCVGFILAPDTIDYAVRAYEAYKSGDETSAKQIYADMLPAVTFVMQGIEHLICYGKRLFGARAGIEIYDRSPAMRPTDFGQETVRLHASSLGKY
jgi:4-hydroxy-tetrahydrodipicolinate synthase